MPHTPDIDILRAYLLDRDVACPVCRYSLSSCQSNVCPECGTPIRLVLQEAPRRGFRAHPHWLFSVASLSWAALTSATTISLGLMLMVAKPRGGTILGAKVRGVVAALLAFASVAGLILVSRRWRSCTPQHADTIFRLARSVAVVYVLQQLIVWIAWRILV